MLIASLLSLVAAIALGLAAVMQHAEARAQPAALSLQLVLLRRLALRPLWLATIGIEIVAVGVQAVALHYGPIATVQAVRTSSVAFALLLIERTRAHRMSRTDASAVIVFVGGMIAFLLEADPSSGTSTGSPARWVGALAIVTMIVAASLMIAARARCRQRAVALGVATGATWAFTTLLLKSTADNFAAHGLRTVATWELWALVVGGIIGTIVNQSAFQSGELAWSLPAMSVIEPIVATCLGILVFGERLNPQGIVAWFILSAGAAAALVCAALLGRHLAVEETTPARNRD